MAAATMAPKQARGNRQSQLDQPQLDQSQLEQVELQQPALNSLDRIGQTAGLIWKLLSVDGPLSITRIVRDLKSEEASRDVIMQGLGWLAREDKIWIDDESRSKMVSLKF